MQGHVHHRFLASRPRDLHNMPHLATLELSRFTGRGCVGAKRADVTGRIGALQPRGNMNLQGTPRPCMIHDSGSRFGSACCFLQASGKVKLLPSTCGSVRKFHVEKRTERTQSHGDGWAWEQDRPPHRFPRLSLSHTNWSLSTCRAPEPAVLVMFLYQILDHSNCFKVL